MSEGKKQFKEVASEFLDNLILDVFDPFKTVGGWILIVVCMFAGEYDIHHKAWDLTSKGAVYVSEVILSD